MLQGFYTAASGMLMQQRNLNVISNNLANAQTPGFKTSRLQSTTFEQALLTRLQNGRHTVIGSGEPARIVREVADVFDAGSIAQTGRPFDVALNGSGFFNVQGEDGQVYLTRDGQFDLDEQGYLILRDKGRVMGAGGPLQLSTSDIDIDETGEIFNAATGTTMGRLNVTEPGANAEIIEVRNSMYQVAGGGVGTAAQNTQVIQGSLENSNVNLTDEMTVMMSAQRNFAAASQALQWIDATYAKATNIASL